MTRRTQVLLGIFLTLTLGTFLTLAVGGFQGPGVEAVVAEEVQGQQTAAPATRDEARTALCVLAVVAHPADAYDMIGGTLANHVEQGDRVVVAIMNPTDSRNNVRLADEMLAGRASPDAATLDEAGLEVTKTAVESCRVLGVKDVRLLSCEGEWLSPTDKLRSTVATLIQDVRPHLMITHHPNEDAGASEHANCGKVVVEAAYLARGARDNGLAPHHVAQIYFMCPPGTTTGLDASSVQRYGAILIDVTSQVEKKINAYAKLSSQYIDKHKAAKIVEAVSGLQAVHACVPYVEAYMPYRPQVYNTLPISDHSKKQSGNSWKFGLDRLRFVAPYVDGVQEAAEKPREK